MQKKQNNKGKTAVKKKEQQSYANNVLARNKGKHPEKQDKSILYYGVAIRDGKNVFLGEVKAPTECIATATLREICGNDVHSLVVKPFKNNNSKFHYNNY